MPIPVTVSSQPWALDADAERNLTPPDAGIEVAMTGTLRRRATDARVRPAIHEAAVASTL